MKFDELFLDKETIALLKKTASGSICEPSSESERDCLYHLDNIGLIQYSSKTASGNPGYAISTTGICYLMYLNDRKKQRSVSVRHYWITTIIAIAAFMLSATSIVMQFFRIG